MAGAVRQPIDVAALERYIEQNVPEVKPPLDLKQVYTNNATSIFSQMLIQGLL